MVIFVLVWLYEREIFLFAFSSNFPGILALLHHTGGTVGLSRSLCQGHGHGRGSALKLPFVCAFRFHSLSLFYFICGCFLCF